MNQSIIFKTIYSSTLGHQDFLSILLLFFLAGLDKYCRLTEPLGIRIAEFPLNPMFAKMLLESGNIRGILLSFALCVFGSLLI